MRRLFLALILWPGLAFAGPLPKPDSTAVNDWAEVISPDVEAKLVSTLSDARRETGVHVVVVTMDDHADFGGAGQSIETYATNLFNAWGIGDRNRNDGVLILVTPGRKAMRIELGRGYGVDWDDTAKGIIDDSFLPAFAEGHIETGIRRGTDQVLDRIVKRFAKGKGPSGRFPIELAIIAGIAALFGGSSLARWFNDKAALYRSCPKCGQRGMQRDHVVDFQPTLFTAGQGATLTRCTHCDYVDRAVFIMSRTGGGSGFSDTDNDDNSAGSSGGGFGGGSSSGGGATGRW